METPRAPVLILMLLLPAGLASEEGSCPANPFLAAGRISLEGLLESCRTLPAPLTPDAGRALEEAKGWLFAGAPLSAVDPLRRALLGEPGCTAAALFLSAIHLDVDGDPRAAYPLLLSAAARDPTSPEALALLARAAGEMGYRRFRDRAREEATELGYDGAERQYRLFQFQKGRDPQRALAAWREYRRLDPGWRAVELPCGQKLRKAAEALSRGEATAAARLAADALEENPFLEEEAGPLLARALLARAEEARAAGEFEVAIADLSTLAQEDPNGDPGRRMDLEARIEEVEAQAVAARLAAANTPAEVEEAVVGLAAFIPGARARYGAEIEEAFSAIAPGAPPDPRDGEARRRAPHLEPAGTAGRSLEAWLSGPSEVPYFPLIEGSRWTFLHGDGAREVQELERVERLKDGRTAYRFACEIQVFGARVPYRRTGYFSGEFFQIGAGARTSGGELVMKVPVVKGEGWGWRKGQIAFEREYVATDARVVCAAGDFEGCLKVKASSRLDAGKLQTRPLVQWFYYAPGVGLVKIEAETPFNGRELVDYRIPPR